MSDTSAKNPFAAAPFVLGGLALAAGLFLGLRGPQDEEPAPAPSATEAAPTAPASVTASAAPAPPPPAAYQPDLSGQDIGELLTEEGQGAHGMAVVGERLVWLETERARLGSLKLEGGAPVTVFDASEAERYGGAFAATADEVFWSVSNLEARDSPVYRLGADALAARARPEIWVEVGELDAILPAEGGAYLVESRRLIRIEDHEPKLLAKTDDRIVGSAYCGGRLTWLEAPLAGGGPTRLMEWRDDEAQRRLPLQSGPTGALLCDQGRLLWAVDEPRGGGPPRWMSLGKQARAPKTLFGSGLVTAAVRTAEAFYWAERHVAPTADEDDEVVSLFRASSADGQHQQRIGRVPGTVTAVAVSRGRLYWADDRGLHQHALGGAKAPAAPEDDTPVK